MAHIATASVMNADDYHLFYCSQGYGDAGASHYCPKMKVVLHLGQVASFSQGHINEQPFAVTPPANLDLSKSLDCERKLRT